MWMLRLALTFLAAFYFVLTVSSGQFTQIRDCTCEGYEQVYECRVNGSGATIWKGSAIDCSNSNKEISLSHLFTNGICNNGAIVGRLVRVENDSYTSQLTVSVSSDMIGRNISCFHEIEVNTTLIDTLLMTTTKDPYPPPNDVQLLDANSTQLTFNWTSVSSNCPAISYQIVANNNCGYCPNVTNDTTVTCDWSFTEENKCTFAVQTVVCDDINIVGNQSQAVSFTLKVPDAPAVIDMVPTYSHEMSKLLAINTTFSETETFNISESIDGSALYYTINYTDTDSNIVCNSTTVSASACLNGQCVVNFQIAQATVSCSKPLSHIGVTVSATNRLGTGLSSIENTTNKFVSINYEMASNTITCAFDGDHVHLGRLKSCSILYGIGSTEGSYCNFSSLTPLWTNSNTSNSSNHVYITIADDIQSQQSPPQEYCFTATAKYGKQTVIINGSFVTVVDKTDTGTLTQTLAIVITAGTFSIALCLLGLLIVVICFNVKRKLSVSKPKPQLTNSGPNREQIRSVSATSAMTEESQLESDQELEPMHIYNILEPPEEQSVESPAQYAEITNMVYVEIEKTSAQGNRPVPPQYDDIMQYTEVSKVPQNKSRTRKTGVDTLSENGTNGMIFQLNHKQVRQNQQGPCLDTQPSMFFYDSQNTQFDQKTTSPLSILNDSFDFTQPPPLPPKNEQSP